ncbi:Uncharacterised protein [Pantoea agglomerans]|uniref:Uncharacterized protein n=1 Tax=Enterobacter agglomerans TaxID=549 RepID=A0A379AMV8_ENTAG|nr:Uncharacterised protein [Pantoea agglomerans]
MNLMDWVQIALLILVILLFLKPLYQKMATPVAGTAS